MKKIDAKHLRYFVEVAAQRSFTRAAETLLVAQPAISTQIQQLERYLGFDLFVRSSRSVELTGEGRRLLPQAKHMIEATEAVYTLAREIRNGVGCSLVVGATPYSSIFPEREALISEFTRRYPGVDLQLDMAAQHDHLLDRCRAGEIDLTFYIGCEISRGDFNVVSFHRYHFALLVPVENPLAKSREIPLSALENQPIAIFARTHSPELYDQLAARLAGVGRAQLIIPPESHPYALAQYGNRQRMLTLHGGGIPPAGGNMVLKPIPQLDVVAEMALVSRRDGQRGLTAGRFWALAMEMSGTGGAAGG